ncbi:MAG TPA: histidine kinase [Saprospiraceae bacterium]|nr:histidine kinase [Saprospiraceae bacterium]
MLTQREKIGGLFLMNICSLFFFWTGSVSGQSSHPLPDLQFYQLNTAHGLSDNYIYDMTIDKNGFLWVGTGEGLNQFNGKSVIKYFHQQYPQLKDDYVKEITCDRKNRIWVLTAYGDVTLIDEKRKFHRIGIYHENKFVPTRWILQTDSQDVILFSKINHYVLNPETDVMLADSLTLSDFHTLEISNSDSLYARGFSQVFKYDGDRYMFVTNKKTFTVNYKNLNLESVFECSNSTFLTKWNEHELLVYNKDEQQLKALDLTTYKYSFPFATLTDQKGNPITDEITVAKKVSENQYVFTSRGNGIYIYDQSSGILTNQRHNAADPTTLVNDYPNTITSDSTGWVFIGARPNGASYFNTKAVIGQQLIFQDKKGNNYDGLITHINTLDNDTYYIGTIDYLLEWKRSTNATTFLEYHDDKKETDEVNITAFDHLQNLWVATRNSGIFVTGKDRKILHHFEERPLPDPSPLNSSISFLTEGPDKMMWISSRNGICKINIDNYSIDYFDDIPLSTIRKISCNHIYFSDDDNLWLCTNGRGLLHYTFSTGNITEYNINSGLLSNNVICANHDRYNNLYVGTGRGLNILLTNGKSKIYTPKNGLLNNRVEALLLDKENRMWLGNDVALACFNIADTSMKVFDERYGLSIQGFRTNAYHQNSDDELIWGTERGLQYFYPDALYDQKINLKTTIQRVETRDLITDLTRSEELFLSPGDNYITFYFSSIDYSTHLRTFYQYKLENMDEDWIPVVDQNAVRYSSLKPGNYIFKVRASNDKKIWVSAENEVEIHLASQFWNRWWFSFLSFGIVIFLIYKLVSSLNKKQKIRTEELETEAVINYFASRINRHQSTDELLWDVVKNCISKLQFEDCVIYLVDQDRNVLVQKAAYGPKSGTDFTIHQPMEIPVGQGIVGNVVIHGEAELINDTSKDPRYIVDDQQRHSELAVPITMEGKVIGVIDSENSKRNFFSQRHLSILSTIAVLCVNQIQRNEAEQEKQKAKMEVIQNKQKATESRLQSLRLQMNPHFLFNALNSIQQMILANEEMVATKYLSRFSKLLRSILIHSDKETISLKEELDILKLYVELESVRFKEAFTYVIDCDEEIDTDEVKIPTLLIQPFVENAIWHGLMHKEGMRNLKISFTDEGEYVQCIIEDNGIGRQKAGELKITSGQDKKHTSKGIEVSLERLKAIQKQGGMSGSMQIVDLKDKDGRGIGTRVEINLPIQN